MPCRRLGSARLIGPLRATRRAARVPAKRGCKPRTPTTASAERALFFVWPARSKRVPAPSLNRVRWANGRCRAVVLLCHAGRDAPALANRQAVLLCPGPDITAALTAGPPGPARLGPPGLAAVLNVGRELLAERGGVLGVQVDLIAGAIESEPHRLLRRAAGQIIFQDDSYFLGHRYLPTSMGCLHRTLPRVLCPGAAPQIRQDSRESSITWPGTYLRRPALIVA